MTQLFILQRPIECEVSSASSPKIRGAQVTNTMGSIFRRCMANCYRIHILRNILQAHWDVLINKPSFGPVNAGAMQEDTGLGKQSKRAFAAYNAVVKCWRREKGFANKWIRHKAV